MKERWFTFVSVVLVAFSYVVMLTQFCDFNPGQYTAPSIGQWCLQHQQLAAMTNILELERASSDTCNQARNLDLVLPPDARVYMDDMLGPTNGVKAGLYFYLTYYLFPRDVAVSIDGPARWTKEGFFGTPAQTYEEVFRHGFNVAVDTSRGTIQPQALGGLQLQPLANPTWFKNTRDVVLAFLLPLLTSLSGLWLFEWLFPALRERTSFLERWACALGLGMMAVGALTLAIKLCGFHGDGWVFALAAAGALAACWRERRLLREAVRSGATRALHSPVFMVGTLVFFLIFRMAGQIGYIDFDTFAGWGLKAKILHLYAGHEIVRWFSEPRLAHAHLDYPTLVPSLHAATYDTLGRVNEFVSKYWNAWMLLLLAGALGALMPAGSGRKQAPRFFVLALVLLPATRKFVQWEGATIPMIFFTVLGLMECAAWQMDREPGRLALGLVLLFGAALAKFEGSIFLLAAVGWLLLLRFTRPRFKLSPQLWRATGFGVAAALPFACFRLQIPVLHYESHWVSYALSHPVLTLAQWPAVFLMLISRWFFNPRFSDWTATGDSLRWTGKWEGFSSLYHHPTLGLGWVCLALMLAVWFAAPARRGILLWLVVVILTSMGAFAAVFSSFRGIGTLSDVLAYTGEDTAQRYLFPLLIAWAGILGVLLFSDTNRGEARPGSGAPVQGKASPGDDER